MTTKQRCCAICKWPAEPHAIHLGKAHGIDIVFSVCARCDAANARLPTGTAQKRRNAAGHLAASDTTGRYYVGRFADAGTAQLAAHMLGNPTTGRDAAKALGWIE